MSAVDTAVFPVAGLGTRFLPATKATPKEMLPVVDKPLVQYAAEEAVAAGIKTLVFVTGRNKGPIADHFDKAYELENELEARGNTEMLECVRSIVPPEIECVYLRQAEALGLGHAVLCARSVTGDRPFAVILADDLIADPDGGGCLSQMVEVFEKHGSSVIGVEKVDPSHTDRYGIVSQAGMEESDRLGRVEAVVEKPAPTEAPSNLAVVGRYIFTPGIMARLADTGPGVGGEIQLTDAIARLLEDEQVLAWRFRGRRFDCGSKVGYLEATVDYALQHPELQASFGAWLKDRVRDL